MAEEIGYEVLLSALINSCNHSSIKSIFKPSFMDKLSRKNMAERTSYILGIKKKKKKKR